MPRHLAPTLTLPLTLSPSPTPTLSPIPIPTLTLTPTLILTLTLTLTLTRYLATSLYAVCVEHAFRLFRPEQFLFLRYEDMNPNPNPNPNLATLQLCNPATLTR